MDIDRRVARHYDVIDEDDRLAIPGLGDLVRLRTWDVFHRFRPTGGSLLDVGGATGVHIRASRRGGARRAAGGAGAAPSRRRPRAELIRAIRLTESEPSMLGVSAHVIGVARA